MAETATAEDQAARFLEACDRLRDAIDLLDRLPDSPSLRQMGMVAGSLLLRCREVSARWRSLPVIAGRLEAPPCRPDAVPLREWPIPQGAWLARRCAALRAGLAGEAGRGDDDSLAGFAEACWPLLNGEDGLLAGLPAVQEEITRRMYQEDLNA